MRKLQIRHRGGIGYLTPSLGLSVMIKMARNVGHSSSRRVSNSGNTSIAAANIAQHKRVNDELCTVANTSLLDAEKVRRVCNSAVIDHQVLSSFLALRSMIGYCIVENESLGLGDR